MSDGGYPFPSHEGLTSYCASCHSAKTARGRETGAARSSKPKKGCDDNGKPLTLIIRGAHKGGRMDDLNWFGRLLIAALILFFVSEIASLIIDILGF
jgi:hypothetical protein